MAVISAFTFNGEFDLLEIHLNCLDEFVDQFVIVECPTTFSGNPKPLYFNPERFRKWMHKIKYHVIDENYSQEELDLARSSPATQFGRGHWMTEFLQKESIKKAITHLNDDDIVFVGDVDEIWDKEALKLDYGAKLKLKVYTYYLNNRSNEEFCGTLYTTYKTIKENCLNNLRNFGHKTTEDYGWHFTSMGDVRKKLLDGYTEDSYANPTVLGLLDENVKNNRDFLGRNFEFKADESEWPEYLKENKDKYRHLLK